jgi:preflagellin peptidase FlaK
MRFVTGTAVLAFAAACDLKWRRAPDAAWLVAVAVGVVVLTAQAATQPDFFRLHLPALVTSGIVFLGALVGYATRILTGGADAKALASLAVLAPVPLDLAWQMPFESPLPLVLTAVANGLVLGLAIPFAMAAFNLVRGDFDGWRTLLGTRVNVDQVNLRVAWALEYYDEDGEHVIQNTPRGIPLDAFDPEAFHARGQDKVWVTPKIPFLVPLFFGFVVAAIAGDPVAAVLELVVG